MKILDRILWVVSGTLSFAYLLPDKVYYDNIKYAGSIFSICIFLLILYDKIEDINKK